MNTHLIKVMDCVEGTSTNHEGLQLLNCLLPFIEKGNPVKVSLVDCTPMSSSFLNSSFGEIIERFGFDTFKKNIQLVNFKPSQAEYIKKYVYQVGRHVK
jgi:hypothetical protein